MTYAEMLRHPNWQRMRLEILERDGFKCSSCGDGETTLHVHHKYYERGHKPWEYPTDALVTYCEPCHADIELAKEFMSLVMRRVRDKDIVKAAMLIADTLPKLVQKEVWNEMKSRHPGMWK